MTVWSLIIDLSHEVENLFQQCFPVQKTSQNSTTWIRAVNFHYFHYIRIQEQCPFCWLYTYLNKKTNVQYQQNKEIFAHILALPSPNRWKKTHAISRHFIIQTHTYWIEWAYFGSISRLHRRQRVLILQQSAMLSFFYFLL